jgi:hypothetical protein
MSVQRSRAAQTNLLWIAGMVSLVFGACGGRVSGDSGSEASGGTANSTGSGGATASTSIRGAAGKAALGAGGAATTTTATGGASTVIACPGIPGAEPDSPLGVSACNGTSIETERLPVDLILLIDRSYSTGFPYGTNETNPAVAGQLRRWDALTSAMESLVAAPEAANLGVSLNFFGSGRPNDASTCNANDYAQPAIALDWLSLNGPTLVATMQSMVPSGISPTVPALTGAYRYAMAQQASDPIREKAVVLISDGWPTACAVNLPSDVTSLIAEAAAAPVPIRTFIVGVGSRATLEATKGNLQAFAVAGGTDRPPYLLDEAADIAGFQQQFVAAMLDIAHSPRVCEYDVLPLSSDWVIDPASITFFYQSATGSSEEIPKLANVEMCPRSYNGGWYFDNPQNPTRIGVCPCTCANYGRRTATVVYGCKPPIYIE